MASNLDAMTALNDYEFIGFSFNGIHCSAYGLTAVSSGLTQQPLYADFENRTIEVPGRDGAYYFGTKVKTRNFSISTAFENMTSANKKSILNWLNPNTVGKLTFDEAPYKYYYVKISSPPSFSFVPFEKNITNGKQHIFKGTIDIEFLATDPYGYSDYAIISQVPIWNGTVFTEHSDYPTNAVHFYDATHLPGWYGESGLLDVAPDPDTLAYANGTNGYTNGSTISAGDLPKNFKNGGELESLVEFTIFLNAFALGDTWQLKNTTPNPDEIFQIGSMRNLVGLTSDAGPWKIVCTPKTGSIIGYTSTDSYTAPYNLGGIHNGFFLKVYPGDNTLTTTKDLSNTTIKYKYKYW
jgi:predicted phage tail component-like protein